MGCELAVRYSPHELTLSIVALVLTDLAAHIQTSLPRSALCTAEVPMLQ